MHSTSSYPILNNLLICFTCGKSDEYGDCFLCINIIRLTHWTDSFHPCTKYWVPLHQFLIQLPPNLWWWPCLQPRSGEWYSLYNCLVPFHVTFNSDSTSMCYPFLEEFGMLQDMWGRSWNVELEQCAQPLWTQHTGFEHRRYCAVHHWQHLAFGVGAFIC